MPSTNTTQAEVVPPTSSKKKFRFYNNLFRLSPQDEAEQVQNYATISAFKSYRKVSAMLLWFSMLITIAYVLFLQGPISSLVDVVIMGILSGFMWRGKKWAFIVGMVLWAYEKIFFIVQNPASLLIQVIWLIVYLSIFYKAYVVEKRREVHEPLQPTMVS